MLNGDFFLCKYGILGSKVQRRMNIRPWTAAKSSTKSGAWASRSGVLRAVFSTRFEVQRLNQTKKARFQLAYLILILFPTFCKTHKKIIQVYINIIIRLYTASHTFKRKEKKNLEREIWAKDSLQASKDCFELYSFNSKLL